MALHQDGQIKGLNEIDCLHKVKIRQKDFEITLFGRLKLIFLVLALDEVKMTVQITVDNRQLEIVNLIIANLIDFYGSE